MTFKRTARGLVVGLIEEDVKKPVAPVTAESAPVEQEKEKKRIAKAAKRSK